MKLLLTSASAALIAGCAAAPATAPPAPTGTSLTYAVTAPVTVTYEFADSNGFNIRGGAIGDIAVTARASGTAEATQSPKGSDAELRIKVTDLIGSFTNSAAGGTTNATEADVQGEAIITVT